MKLLYSKHPIFSKELHVFGYELLYKDMDAREDEAVSEVEATAKMMPEVLGNDDISGKKLGHLAFVHFTREMLLSQIAFEYPVDLLVVVLTAGMAVDVEVIEACKKLREKGYIVALTDLGSNIKSNLLFPFACLLKIDWRNMNSTLLHEISGLKSSKVRLLAMHVDTQQEYEQAKQIGFNFYQGFFFAKPVPILLQSHETSRVTTMQLLTESMKRPMSFTALSNIIQRDAVATYKLLKIVNSAYYSVRNEIKDIRRALMFLGETEIRKWAILLSMITVGKDKPDELIRFSFRRAEFCQSLAKYLRVSHDEYFLIGLLSLIDVVMGCTMEQALSEIVVSDMVRNALTAIENKPAKILEALMSYELGDWDASEELFDNLEIPIEVVADLFSEADKRSYQLLT